MKKLVKKIMACSIAALMLGTTACSGKKEQKKSSGSGSAEPAPLVTLDHVTQTSDSLYVKKVEGLRDDFIMGCDVSTVISLEKS